MALSKIVASLNYLQGFNNQGDLRALDTKTNRSLVYFDGTSVGHFDGGDTEQIKLPDLKVSNANLTHLAGFDENGRLFRWTRSGIESGFLVYDGASLTFKSFAEAGFIGIPSGFGIPIRLPGLDLDAQPFSPSMFAEKGLVYISTDGTVTPVDGIEGQIIRIVGGVPVFVAPDAGSAVAGAASVGMSGVSSSSTGAKTINLQAPSFELTDGVDTTTAIGVNANLDLDAVNGVGALDIGAVAPNTWYYVYVVSDETTAGLVASLSGTSPDLTNLGAFTFYSIASIIRTATDIVPFLQRGRNFFTRPQLWGNALTISRAWAVITSGTPFNTLVPPNVKSASGIMGGQLAPTTSATKPMAIAADANGLGMQFFGTSATMVVNSSSESDGFYGCAFPFKDVPISNPASPALYWKAPSTSGTADTERRIMITGYAI